MNKNETYYAIATQQGSSVKLEIRETVKGNIVKNQGFGCEPNNFNSVACSSRHLCRFLDF